MRYHIVIDMDTNKEIFEQVKRNGLALVREGGGLTVEVPNRVVSKCSKCKCNVRIEPVETPDS